MPLNLSFTHIMVVAFVALLVLGPERLPGVARTAGNLYREWKRISGGLEAEVRSALSEFTEPISDLVHGPTENGPTENVPTENVPTENVPTSPTPTGSAPTGSGPAVPSSGTAPGTGSLTVPPLAPVFASLGPGTGLLSIGPSFEPALPELAPPPEPGTFVPYSPGSGGHG